jgi:hypothetical protein
VKTRISLGAISRCKQLRRIFQEELEDTKGVIRIRKSMKNRKHNGQKKKYKRKNNDPQNIYMYIKLKVTRIPLKSRGELRCP